MGFTNKKFFYVGLFLFGIVLAGGFLVFNGRSAGADASKTAVAKRELPLLGKGDPVAVISPASQVVNRTPATVSGASSYHPVRNRRIVKYDFAFSAPVNIVFQDEKSVTFFISQSPTYVTLTVTDDRGRKNSATAVVTTVAFPTPTPTP